MNPESILCRASVQLAPTLTGEPMYMPGGVQEITPFSGGIGKPIKVRVDASGAQAIEEQRAALVARGKRPYFDFNHEDGPASFWPDKFYWNGTDIMASGEWSSRGKKSVEGKDFRYFSPVFHVDNKRGDPAQIVCRDKASPNMGGLTNDPAFQILPLWAKNAGDNGDADNNNREKRETEMTTEEIAALRATQAELKTKVDELAAKSGEDAATRYNEANAELRATTAELELAELQARSEKQEEAIRARSRDDAKAAVKAAVMKGAILPKDVKTQNELIARATLDPSFIDTIKAMQGTLTSTLTTSVVGTVQVGREDPIQVYSALSKILARNGKAKHDEKVKGAREVAALYASEFRGDNRSRLMGVQVRDLQDAIMAGDVTDGDLGTLAGTLVAQRVLELLKFSFPSLTSFTTDFSNLPATFNQTIMTRTVDIPDVVTYSTSTGWADSDASTNDVPIVIDKHEGVQITFNENILASTMRKLFDEFAPAQAYALAKSMVDDLYSNLTDANFPNNAVVATSAFTRASVVGISTDLDILGVPQMLGDRTLLLYPTVFAKLETDTTLMNLAAYQKTELITNPTPNGVSLSIPVSTFNVIKAPNLPTNNGNVTGFAGSRSALCIATRTPNDYTSILPGASFGNVQMVTDPDIGITVMLVQYVNHTLGTATSRIALMYGTAPGQGDAGELIKAASGSGSSRS
jgi:phage I-like protein